jgi:hypothetical protein
VKAVSVATPNYTSPLLSAHKYKVIYTIHHYKNIDIHTTVYRYILAVPTSKCQNENTTCWCEPLVKTLVEDPVWRQCQILTALRLSLTITKKKTEKGKLHVWLYAQIWMSPEQPLKTVDTDSELLKIALLQCFNNNNNLFSNLVIKLHFPHMVRSTEVLRYRNKIIIKCRNILFFSLFKCFHKPKYPKCYLFIFSILNSIIILVQIVSRTETLQEMRYGMKRGPDTDFWTYHYT